MKIKALEIPDVKVLYPAKFDDDRGFFSEIYNKSTYEKIGIQEEFVQDNHSLSRAVGVIRGLHYQCSPFAQAKLVRVVRGTILDVAVDIRKNSETFGRWVSAEISAQAWNQIYIPKGFAHGFVTLEENTEVNYKVSARYAPELEKSIAWNDPALKIEWRISEGAVTLSDKDRQPMSFAAYCQCPDF